MPVADLPSQLRRDEGTSLRLYKDTVGKLTIGTGRNLTDDGISPDESDLMLANDIKSATVRLESAFPWTMGLDAARQGVLLNMTFNMGIGGLAGFKDMLAKLSAGDYAGAAQAMLQSQWATQVGDRAQRLAIQMEGGQWQ
jgi:lysozyme